MNITSRITSATFSACIVKKEDLPKDDLPIVALLGRSNVGKSSLINSLTGRKELARTSSTPGKTLTMNFYCINDAFYLVDLPGYGYAKASKATRNKIQSMMDDFFTNCTNLKGVVQIIDIRHKPTPLDIQMHNWIKEQRINGFVVLTKSDKLSNQQVIKMRSQILKEITDIYAIVYSSKLVLGRDEFLDALEKILAGYEFKIIDSKQKLSDSSISPQETRMNSSSHIDEKPVSTQKVSRPKMTGETQNKPKIVERDNSRNNNQTHRNNMNRDNPRSNRRDLPNRGKPIDSTSRRSRNRQPRNDGKGSKRD